ncbi:hypothetical protein NUSPORA_00444 [Nucleospora cyclopteri]
MHLKNIKSLYISDYSVYVFIKLKTERTLMKDECLNGYEYYLSNYFLFIDNPNLLAASDETIIEIVV